MPSFDDFLRLTAERDRLLEANANLRDQLDRANTGRQTLAQELADLDTVRPDVTPTNTTETADNAAQRFASELWRLASGLADRGIELLPNSPIDTAPVDTALAAIDASRRDRSRLARVQARKDHP